MPRKSAAALATVCPITDHRPAAPKELTAEQAEEWRAIVGRRLPREWITREVQPLLVAYLQHWSTCRFLSKQIDAFNPDWIADPGGFERYSSWLALRARETKALADLATIALTNQSRYFPSSAARQAQREPFGHIESDGQIKLALWQKHRKVRGA